MVEDDEGHVLRVFDIGLFNIAVEGDFQRGHFAPFVQPHGNVADSELEAVHADDEIIAQIGNGAAEGADWMGQVLRRGLDDGLYFGEVVAFAVGGKDEGAVFAVQMAFKFQCHIGQGLVQDVVAAFHKVDVVQFGQLRIFGLPCLPEGFGGLVEFLQVLQMRIHKVAFRWVQRCRLLLGRSPAFAVVNKGNDMWRCTKAACTVRLG